MINIQEIVDTLWSPVFDTVYYYDRDGDEIISVFSPDHPPELYDENPELYVPLPELYLEDQVELIGRFLDQAGLDDEVTSLLRAAHHNPDRFMNQLYQYPEAEKQWNHFYRDTLSLIARQWCQENEIPFEEPAKPLVPAESQPEQVEAPVEMGELTPVQDGRLSTLALLEALRQLHRRLSPEAFDAALDDIRDRVARYAPEEAE